MKKVILAIAAVLTISSCHINNNQESRDYELNAMKNQKPVYLYTLDGCKVYSVGLHQHISPNFIVTCPCDCK